MEILAGSLLEAPCSLPLLLVCSLEALLHSLDELVDAKTRRPLTRRILFERLEKFAYHCRGREERTCSVRHEPIVVGIRGDVRTLVGV
jgi:hypothetical protein